MIKDIRIDGFRSLSDFSLELRPGINILVGPNGAGKTNIISFFKFLSWSADCSLSEAISRLGGVRHVFRYSGSDKQDKKIQYELFGVLEDPQKNNRKNRRLLYRYKVEIFFNSNTGVVQYTNQCFQFKRASKKLSYQEWRDDASRQCDVEFKQFFDAEKRSQVHLTKLSKKNLLQTPLLTSLKKNTREKLDVGAIRPDYANPEVSLLTIAEWFVGEIRLILALEIRGSYVFKIDPEKVKAPERPNALAEVDDDGSGVVSTLYALGRNEDSISLDKIMRRSFAVFNEINKRKQAFENIEKYFRVLDDAYAGISVSYNYYNDVIGVGLNYKSGENEVEIPLSLASDGTVKWLALMTALFTRSQILAIEEPENFLHPGLQREILSICRDSFAGDGVGEFILMSTHSETLLNAAEPSELLITSLEQGVTLCRRPEDASHVSAVIEETGFGLGSFYVSGALDHA